MKDVVEADLKLIREAQGVPESSGGTFVDDGPKSPCQSRMAGQQHPLLRAVVADPSRKKAGRFLEVSQAPTPATPQAEEEVVTKSDKKD